MDGSIKGSPRQESSPHEALPPRSVVPKGPLSTETGGKAQEALSQGKRRRAEEAGEKQGEESTQAEPRDGKLLGKMQTLTDQRGSATRKLHYRGFLDSEASPSLSCSENLLRPRSIETDGIIESSPRQESLSHQHKCFDALQLFCHCSPDLYDGKWLCPTQKRFNSA